MDPITGALIGGTAAGAIGGLFSKKAKAPNYGQLFNQLDQSGQRQRDIIGSVRPQTTQMNTQYGQNVSGLTQALTQKNDAMGRDYLRDVSSASTALGNNLSDTLRQRVSQQTPEMMRQMKEQMAATGGLNRGASSAALANLAVGQANQIGQGQRDIANQELANRTKALDTVFQADQATLMKATGLDYDTMQKLWYSGRGDLIDEAAQLVQEEQMRNSQKMGLMGSQMQMDFAGSTANAARQNDLISSLLSSMGTAAGYKFAGEGK